VSVLAELVGHAAIWPGSISHVAVDVFVLWLPAAVLLPICALVVGDGSMSRRPGAIPAARVAVAGSAILGLVPAIIPAAWASIPWWSDALGGAFIYVPLLAVAATVVVAAIRRDPVAKTSAALLVGAGCFPIVWLLPMVTIHIMPDPWFTSSLWFLCYAPGVVIVCLVMWALLRRRRMRSPRVA